MTCSGQPHTFTHVLFDMDGVLLDTEPLYTQAIQEVAARFGKTFDWSLKEQIMGRGRVAAAEFLVKALELPLDAASFLVERDAVLLHHLAEAPEVAGAEAFTRRLHASGLKLAVATSSERRLFELKTRLHRDWFSIFSVVVCGDDPRLARTKPSPDIFLLAAREMGAEPARCLVFEDSPAGVEAALAAGMRVVALPDPNLSPGLMAKAHHLIPGYHAFPFELLGL